MRSLPFAARLADVGPILLAVLLVLALSVLASSTASGQPGESYTIVEVTPTSVTYTTGPGWTYTAPRDVLAWPQWIRSPQYAHPQAPETARWVAYSELDSAVYLTEETSSWVAPLPGDTLLAEIETLSAAIAGMRAAYADSLASAREDTAAALAAQAEAEAALALAETARDEAVAALAPALAEVARLRTAVAEAILAVQTLRLSLQRALRAPPVAVDPSTPIRTAPR